MFFYHGYQYIYLIYLSYYYYIFSLLFDVCIYNNLVFRCCCRDLWKELNGLKLGNKVSNC